MTATISLHSNWIKFTLESRYIFYNISEQVLSYHPPFPLSELSAFLRFYKFKTDTEKFIQFLSGNEHTIPLPSHQTESNQSVNSVSNETREFSESPLSEIVTTQTITPINDDRIISEIKKLIGKENNIANFVSQVFKMKFGAHPLYQYTNTDKSLPQKAIVTLKGMELIEGKMMPNRVLARLSVDKVIIELLVPSLYDEINLMLFYPKEETIRKCQKETRKKGNKTKQYIDSHKTSQNIQIQSTPISELLIDNPSIVTQYKESFKYSPYELVGFVKTIPGNEIEVNKTKRSNDGIEYYHCSIVHKSTNSIFDSTDSNEEISIQSASQKYLKFLFQDMKYFELVKKIDKQFNP